MTFVVAYDIPDDHRRERLSNTLRNYGRRVQMSVFVADLDAELADRMLEDIRRIISMDEDKLHTWPLCQTCVGKTTAMGLAEIPEDKPYYIL